MSETHTFTLDAFLSALAKQLKDKKNKHLAALFVGEGEILPQDHGFRQGGLAQYMISQLQGDLNDPAEAAKRLGELTAAKVAAAAKAFFTDPEITSQIGYAVKSNEGSALEIVNTCTAGLLQTTKLEIHGDTKPTFVVAKNLQGSWIKNVFGKLRLTKKAWRNKKLAKTLDKASDTIPRLNKILNLVNSGADPNVQDKDGWTALHYAARYGTAEMVQSLINAGADPTIKSIYFSVTARDLVNFKNQADTHTSAMLAILETAEKEWEMRKSLQSPTTAGNPTIAPAIEIRERHHLCRGNAPISGIGIPPNVRPYNGSRGFEFP